MRTANPSKCSECKTEQDIDAATELHSAPSEHAGADTVLLSITCLSVYAVIYTYVEFKTLFLKQPGESYRRA